MLAIVNNAAMNTGVHVSFRMKVLGFCFEYQAVGLPGHMVVLFSVF